MGAVVSAAAGVEPAGVCCTGSATTTPTSSLTVGTFAKGSFGADFFAAAAVGATWVCVSYSLLTIGAISSATDVLSQRMQA